MAASIIHGRALGKGEIIMPTTSIALCACALAMAVAGAAVMAQDQPAPGSMPARGQDAAMPMTHGISNEDMADMHGMHTMPATVTHADTKTGLVDVMSEGMQLRVHFPPAAMANLKAGDKIGLYMGYSQANLVK
jgi:hypothetical protein